MIVDGFPFYFLLCNHVVVYFFLLLSLLVLSLGTRASFLYVFEVLLSFFYGLGHRGPSLCAR